MNIIDDNDIYTGMTGADETFGNEKPSEANQDELDKQKLDRDELKSKSEAILKVIDAEKETSQNFHAYLSKVGTKAKSTEIQDEFRARELYLEYLDTLKSKISIQLKEIKK